MEVLSPVFLNLAGITLPVISQQVAGVSLDLTNLLTSKEMPGQELKTTSQGLQTTEDLSPKPTAYIDGISNDLGIVNRAIATETTDDDIVAFRETLSNENTGADAAIDYIMRKMERGLRAEVEQDGEKIIRLSNEPVDAVLENITRLLSEKNKGAGAENPSTATVVNNSQESLITLMSGVTQNLVSNDNSKEALTNSTIGATQNLVSNENLNINTTLGSVQNRSLSSTAVVSPEEIINSALNTTNNTLESMIQRNQASTVVNTQGNTLTTNNSTQVLGSNQPVFLNTEFGTIQSPGANLGQISRSPLSIAAETPLPTTNFPGLFNNLTQAIVDQGQNLVTAAGSTESGNTSVAVGSGSAQPSGTAALDMTAQGAGGQSNSIMMGSPGGSDSGSTVILTQILHALTNGTAKFKLTNV